MRRATVVIASVAAVAAAGVAGVIIHQGREPRGEVPAATAPVAVVAAAYLGAAKDHDCDLTRALAAKNGTWAWCDNPRLLSYKDVGQPYAVDKDSSPVPQKCVAFTMTTTGSSDGSISRGSEPWSLCFVHTSDGWRLFDQGQG